MRIMKKIITPDFLRECLDYDPESGVLIWKIRPNRHFDGKAKGQPHEAAIWNSRYAGKPAFRSVGNHGYNTSTLSGVQMTGHRVSWAVYFGVWPENEIDHINGKKTDNRLANLREVTRSENARNLSVRSGESRGVYLYAPTGRWVAKITVSGKMLHLGYYKDRGEAVEARRNAEKIHGFHENHGREV